MTSHLDSASVQLQVNLAVVRGHYADALRPHFRGQARAAQYRALRDIPFLINEIERLRALLDQTLIHYANLRAAALTAIIAHDAYEPDPSSHLRAALSLDNQRHLRRPA